MGLTQGSTSKTPHRMFLKASPASGQLMPLPLVPLLQGPESVALPQDGGLLQQMTQADYRTYQIDTHSHDNSYRGRSGREDAIRLSKNAVAFPLKQGPIDSSAFGLLLLPEPFQNSYQQFMSAYGEHYGQLVSIQQVLEEGKGPSGLVVSMQGPGGKCTDIEMAF